jgi:ribosomal 30S subunit maturation factor RimM
VHRLIGARVIDAAGADHGEVVAVQANPAADLLVLASGALVPVNFVVDTAVGEVRVDTPAGLFELYENP